MSFQGEVGAIGLADVLGNISANSLAGTLHVTSERGEAWLSFNGGAIAAFSAGPGKALSGAEIFRLRTAMKEEDVDALAKKKKRTKKAWPEFVEAAGAMKADAFRQLAMNELVDCAVEVFFWAPARFEFVDGPPSEEVFDADLGVTLDVNSLVMEAARRRDHWEMINKVVGGPEDIFVRKRPDANAEGQPDFSKKVFALCDGSKSLRGIEEKTKASRFQVYNTVTELVRANLLRPLSPEEMVRLADGHAKAARTGEAIRLYRRSLETEHANVGVREKLAEVYAKHGDAAKAAGEYKLIAHRALEQGDAPGAIGYYRKATALVPDDVPTREKLIQVLRQTGKRDDASTEAFRLAVLARKMLMHDRALAALDVALECNPALKEAGELRVETLLTLGKKQEAVRQLEEIAAATRGDDAVVAVLQRAVKIEPARSDLKKKIEDIRSGRTVRFKRALKRLAISAVAMVILAALGTAAGFEIRAGLHYQSLESEVHVHLINGDFPSAVIKLRAFATNHPWTLAARHARKEADSVKAQGVSMLQRRLIEAPETEKEAVQRLLNELQNS